MGASFRVVGAHATIDGADVHRSESAGARPSELRTPFCASRTLVQLGTHQITVDVALRGHGYGVFAYLSRYRFTARSHARIDLPRDVYGAVAVATVYEAGDATTPLEDRPQVRWAIRPATHATDGCFP